MESIREFYRRYAELHGNTLGWPTLDDALIVYDAATRSALQAWPTIRSVLDVGSGEALLASFLREQRGFGGHYLGIELFEPSHRRALEHHGSREDVELVRGEFLAHDFGDRRFDWVFSLGSLSAEVRNHSDYERRTIARMLESSVRGITVYVNDVELMPPQRLKQVPGLVGHHIPSFVDRLRGMAPGAELEVHRLPGEEHCVLLHLAKGRPR